MSAITTHVLDTSRGRPAAGIAIRLDCHLEAGWQTLGIGTTDDDGRLRTLLPEGTRLEAGLYRLTFETASYFAALDVPSFYPRVEILFEVRRPEEHYHVPLLLNPFGYSTYRGS